MKLQRQTELVCLECELRFMSTRINKMFCSLECANKNIKKKHRKKNRMGLKLNKKSYK